jgi:hypothetical protein
MKFHTPHYTWYLVLNEVWIQFFQSWAMVLNRAILNEYGLFISNEVSIQ